MAHDKNPEVASDQKKRNRVIIYILLVSVLLLILVYLTWWIIYHNYETTDDAYVTGDLITITSRVEGCIVSYFFNTTQFVKEGDILIQLDPDEFLLSFEGKKAALALAARDVLGLYETVKQKKANFFAEKIKYDRAELDFKNREALNQIEAIPKEEYEHASSQFKVAQSTLDIAFSELEVSLASLGTFELHKHPQIEKAKIEAKEAFLALQYCTIRAPLAGFIAKRNVQVGQTVRAGSPLMTVVPLGNIWIEANYKESQLRNIRIGQPVTFTTDIYGSDVVYKGTVDGILAGSGTVFSLLPPQNATGNWIKVVQRIPVRISLDKDQDELKNHPLFLGLSAYSSIDISDTSGVMLSEKATFEKVKTNIFSASLDNISDVLDRIIEENLAVPNVTERDSK